MEYLDILDENGRPTGKTASRDEAHRKGLWHRSVHIWIVNSKDQALIQKRKASCKSYPNLWDVSAVGHVDAGSSSIDSAIRETKEEIGLGIKPSDLKYLFTLKLMRVLVNGTYINNDFNDTYMVRKDIPLEMLKPQEEEVADLKWIPVPELKQLYKTPSFVPREKEYIKLFKYLNEANVHHYE